MHILENRRRSVILIIALCLMAMMPVAEAASFDCDAAKFKVEHLICTDQGVNKLDDRLDELYGSTMETARDQAAFASAQRAWLIQRNSCADATCLTKSYNERIAALAKVPVAEWLIYHDATLGISFDYLANRQVKPCPKDTGHGPLCVALMGRRMSHNEYLIAFDVKNEPLDRAAGDSAIFAKVNGKWIADAGPGGPVEAESVSGHGWTGITADIVCNIQDALGTHAAGDCLWEVISNGKRSMIADTQGVFGTDEYTARSLASVRFGP